MLLTEVQRALYSQLTDAEKKYKRKQYTVSNMFQVKFN